MVARRRPDPRSPAVLDWEMGAIGDPRADVGYLLATYTRARRATEPARNDTRHRDPGLPVACRARRALRGAQRTRRRADSRWFEALALWKAAVFCEAIYGRYVRGELGAEDTRAARFEQGVPLLAEAALGAIV